VAVALCPMAVGVGIGWARLGGGSTRYLTLTNRFQSSFCDVEKKCPAMARNCRKVSGYATGPTEGWLYFFFPYCLHSFVTRGWALLRFRTSPLKESAHRKPGKVKEPIQVRFEASFPGGTKGGTWESKDISRFVVCNAKKGVDFASTQKRGTTVEATLRQNQVKPPIRITLIDAIVG
jgi:hypothetical protein